MLTDTLKNLNQPQKLDKVFTDNKESVLYDKLTASLRDAVQNIKDQMKTEMGQMISQVVKEEVLKKIPAQRIPMKHGGGAGGGGGSTIVSEDLSSQVTGSTRTFTRSIRGVGRTR